jgi:hypothetical protein
MSEMKRVIWLGLGATPVRAVRATAARWVQRVASSTRRRTARLEVALERHLLDPSPPHLLTCLDGDRRAQHAPREERAESDALDLRSPARPITRVSGR